MVFWVTVKDAVVNVLVFVLAFLVTVGFFLGGYSLSLTLVPGGRGLVFANPFAAALLPGLLIGLIVAQFRAVRRPGNFALTWGLLAAAFFLLLTLSIPVIQQTPPVRASDESPLVPGRFLPLEDGSLLLAAGSATVLVPDSGAMTVAAQTQFDPMNQRFVFSTGEPKAVGGTGPERAYYQFTPALLLLQSDLLAVYSVLRDSLAARPFVYWFQAAAITWLFLGLFVFFSIKTWRMVHVVLVLLMARLGFVFLVYAWWSVPALVDLWVPASTAVWARVWAPLLLVGVADATLFFMTWLTKPWRREALT